MKRAALPIAALAMLEGIALAHAGDPPAQLRDCNSMAGQDRLTCLLARAAVPPARPAPPPARPGPGDWIISQTTSPIDYAPIASATTSSRDRAGGSAMQLSIRCRGGRTELVISGAGVSGRGEDYLISYRVSGGKEEQVVASAATFGGGLEIKGDPVALVRSLPGEGELAVHLSPRIGAAQDGVFSLAGLETVRARLKAACKWPSEIPMTHR
jgi:hypothetical protein